MAIPQYRKLCALIETVFAAQENETLRIPLRLPTAACARKARAAEAFLRVMDLRGGRFGATTVFATSRRLRFVRIFAHGGRSRDLRPWIDRVGNSLGHRCRAPCQPGFAGVPANTWREGFQRLLLGYALRAMRRRFSRIFFRERSGRRIAVKLGRFIDFAEILFTKVPRLSRARSLAEWAAPLSMLVDALFDAATNLRMKFRRCVGLSGVDGHRDRSRSS